MEVDSARPNKFKSKAADQVALLSIPTFEVESK
jgi:hypothetical protein